MDDAGARIAEDTLLILDLSDITKTYAQKMELVLAVFYFMAVKLDTSAKLSIISGYILKAAKRVFGIPDFKSYAMNDGISAIFKRSPDKIHTSPTEGLDPNQLGLGFT